MNITIQNTSKTKHLPTKKQFALWVLAALPAHKKKSEINIRIVGIDEITELNKKYRNKNRPTNILSFNFYSPPDTPQIFLGDLVICAPVVKLEAKLQHKPISSHFAHLTIHGTLHLLGFDHENDTDAATMEKAEIKILKKLKIANPY